MCKKRTSQINSKDSEKERIKLRNTFCQFFANKEVHYILKFAVYVKICDFLTANGNKISSKMKCCGSTKYCTKSKRTTRSIYKKN